jgi:hypothetical protein
MKTNLADRVVKASSLRDVFEALRAYSGLGPFLAYQFAIDLNYTDLIDFSESEFIVAGPGARNGIRKCFGSSSVRTDSTIIQAACDHQEQEFEKRGLKFDLLWGRRLQLIDCQNLFCELDKYARLAHPEVMISGRKKRIKQKFNSTKPVDRPWFPPKWGINETVARWWSTHAAD